MTTTPRTTATPTSGDGGDGASYAAVGTPKDAGGLLARDGNDAHAISTTALVTTASTTTRVDDAAIASGSATAATGADAASAPVTLRDLYRYASACDRVLLGVGLVMVAVNGALFPFMAILFGEAVGSFQPVDMARIERVAAAFAAVAVALFVTDYIAHVCLETTAQKQMHALRIHVFRHVIYKEVAWFERGAPDATSIAELHATTARIKDGMGVKLGEVLRCATQFATGYAIGFSRHWQLSIVMAAVTPFMAISLSWIIKTLRTRAALSQQVYAQAGAVADETLRSIRTVKAFNGEARAVDNYVAKAKRAEAENVKLVRVLSVVLGIFFGMIWVTYGVGLWFGASVVSNGGEADPRTIFSAFYGILIGTISLAQISPNLAAVVSAKVVATPLFKILNEPSRINAEAESSGIVPPTCTGQIVIVNVEFAYPTRPETPVLHDYNLTIQAGETVAFVGPSGGGKSTLVGLLLRYYDPDAGQIYLDGHLIQDLQLQWLRRQIGIVSQEPVLFAGTIFDNIAAALPEFGEHGDFVGRPERLERRKERIETAAILAHAHEFIMALPSGYDTFVGEKGVALSGGQKQRIAIARALVRDPRILILDEATSALDTESEAQIQNALDSIITQTSCTTLIVAHRLSTIKRAERICVVVDGQIVETGTHEQLLQNEDGKFQELVMKSRFPMTMIQRNASLMWCDSLTNVLSSDRDSSVPILAARSLFDTDIMMDSKRSDFVTTKVPYEEDDSSATHGKVNSDALSVKDHESQPESAELGTLIVVHRLLQLNSKENHLFAIGMLAAALNGASFPVSAILLSAIVSTMVNKYAAFRASQNQFELDLLYDDVWRLSLAYLVGAVILVFITFVQSYALRYKAEILVTRLRDLYFRAMCLRDVAFFDDPKNGSGALASDLATKPTQAVILAGDTPGRIVQAVTTFVGALLVSFLMGSWMLSLIMCVLFPLLILSDFVRTNTLKGGGSKTNRNGEDHSARANVLAAEAVTHIRTVASFGMEKRLIDEYRQLSLLPMQENARVAHSNGMALGFSSFITLAVYAVVFWLGAKLVKDGKITFTELIRSLMAIMISATGIGQATSHLTELDEAKAAARSIFQMQDGSQTPKVASEPSKDRPAALGAIEFRDVMFAYPTRPDTAVMRAFNLRIESGQLVALCGPSGGGKSTVITLLERFYEPLRGSITLDGARLDSLDPWWLRSQLGLIAQEPVLFVGSIHDNIAYGAKDPSSVTRAQVQQAAEVAQAHTFISTFPDGYDTDVGANGEQLSGGQKQRIAIARAVLKDPSILLLDEATSALDADSEQLVQDALERVIKLKKRTTIVIAHRMRTIRHADKICVIASGEVVEHSELLRVAGGLYAKLVENAHDDRFDTAD